jgi:hypothetical protein
MEGMSPKVAGEKAESGSGYPSFLEVLNVLRESDERDDYELIFGVPHMASPGSDAGDRARSPEGSRSDPIASQRIGRAGEVQNVQNVGLGNVSPTTQGNARTELSNLKVSRKRRRRFVGMTTGGRWAPKKVCQVEEARKCLR